MYVIDYPNKRQKKKGGDFYFILDTHNNQIGFPWGKNNSFTSDN